MPIYEYRCEDCSQDSSILVRSPKTAAPPKCEHCGSAKVSRKISAVARRRSVGDVVGEYGSDLDGGGIRDPRQIGHWVEKRFEQFGVDVPKSTRDMINAARDGVMPEGLDI
ncbi:MAG: zinc ribbon domain-containing protein [Chloroflexi bacterium]|nr:zinc ribbon domain-containing protein [Chloroflexota bacterium]